MPVCASTRVHPRIVEPRSNGKQDGTDAEVVALGRCRCSDNSLIAQKDTLLYSPAREPARCRFAKPLAEAVGDGDGEVSEESLRQKRLCISPCEEPSHERVGEFTLEYVHTVYLIR